MTDPKYTIPEALLTMREGVARAERDIAKKPDAEAIAKLIFTQLNKTLNLIGQDDPESAILIGRYLSARISMKCGHDLMLAIDADNAIKKAQNGY